MICWCVSNWNKSDRISLSPTISIFQYFIVFLSIYLYIHSAIRNGYIFNKNHPAILSPYTASETPRHVRRSRQARFIPRNVIRADSSRPSIPPGKRPDKPRQAPTSIPASFPKAERLSRPFFLRHPFVIPSLSLCYPFAIPSLFCRQDRRQARGKQIFFIIPIKKLMEYLFVWKNIRTFASR